MTRPYTSPLLTHYINPLVTSFTNHAPYLPFQSILLARKLVVTLFIAFSHLGPLLTDPSSPKNAPAKTVKEQLERVAVRMQATDFEASRLLGLEMAPFAGDAAALSSLKARMQEWLVQNTIRADPEVRDAVGKILNKRRADAPAGAKGTK